MLNDRRLIQGSFLGIVNAIAAWVFVCVILSKSARAQDELAELHAAMAQSWEGRGERIKTGRILWSETTLRPKPSQSPEDWEERGLPPIPADDIRTSQRCTLLFDGLAKRRVSRAGEVYLVTDQRVRETERDVAYDGSEGRAFTPTRIGKLVTGDEIPHGYIQAEDPTLNVINYNPLLWGLGKKPAAQRGFEAQSLVPQAFGVPYRNLECLVLDEPAGVDSVVSRRAWLDPAREYVVIRTDVTIVRTGRLSVQYDIDYINEPEVGWVPSLWDIQVFLADGRLDYSVHGEVVDSEYNLALTPADFHIEFPPETHVTVVDANGNASERFVVLADGDKRTVIESELGAPHDELLRTQTGQAHRPPRPGQNGPERRTHVVLLLNGVALLLICGYMLARRWLSRKQPPQKST